MFAYIDEAGHTGPNLFDPAQPNFYYGVLSSKVDVDVVYGSRIRRIAASVGATAIHANELGAEKVEAILPELQEILIASDCRFDLSKIVKADLAVTKLFDSIFDSAENVAVPWQAYNMVALRNILLLKLAYLLDEGVLRAFWDSLLDRDEVRSQTNLVDVLREIRSRVSRVPDARGRQVLSDGLDWAIKHPEVLQYHSTSRAHVKGHMPNAVAFPDLLRAIHTKSKQWGRKVKTIKVDQQSQFNTTQKFMHEIFREAAPGKVAVPLGLDPYELRLVPESKLQVCASKDSPGIQMADVLLWVSRQLDMGRAPGYASVQLFRQLGRRTRVYELSLRRIEQWTSEAWTKINQAEMSDESIRKGAELVSRWEQRRLDEMARYETMNETGSSEAT